MRMEEWSRTSATSIRSDDACLTAHQAKMVGASVHVWDIFTNFRPTTRTVPLGFLQKTQMEVYMTSCDKHSSREGMCFINSPQDFGQGHIRDPPPKTSTSTYLDLPRPTSTYLDPWTLSSPVGSLLPVPKATPFVQLCVAPPDRLAAGSHALRGSDRKRDTRCPGGMLGRRPSTCLEGRHPGDL